MKSQRAAIMDKGWPDLSEHDRAWEQAKKELPDADAKVLLDRAEEIRNEKSGTGN